MVELIILGIISHAGQPLHGYEIKKYLKQYHVGEYAEISYGSIYYNLGRMENEGLIKGKSIKDTQRPERTLYQITSRGKARLMKLLRQNYAEIQRQYDPFDIAVFMMALMPKDEVLKALKKRIDTFRDMLKSHSREKENLKGKVPFYGLAILDHALHYFQAEISWLEDLTKQVEVNDEWSVPDGKIMFDDYQEKEKADEHGGNKATHQDIQEGSNRRRPHRPYHPKRRNIRSSRA